MFSWNAGCRGESLVSASTKTKPQTCCPNRCSQLLPLLYTALLCREILTSQDAGFRILWDTRVEAGRGGKVMSILRQSLVLVEALHRGVWSITTSFPLLSPYHLQPRDTKAAGQMFHSVSKPKCSTSFVCHKGSTCFYLLFECCNRGIEPLVLSEAPWNLSDRAEPYYWRGDLSRCLQKWSRKEILQHCATLCQNSENN